MLHEQIENGIRWLTLDRADALNAFTAAGYVAMGETISAARADVDTRVVVITGSGRAFSAGADRSLFEGDLDVDERRVVQAGFRSMLLSLSECDKPVLAAVNGVAVGVGATILLHCDLVLMAESARLRLPFTHLGLTAEAASSVLLPARVRWGDAAWSLLSSEWIDADAALAMGLAWRVVPDDRLLATARDVAAKLAALDPDAVSATKRLLLHGRRDLVDAALTRETEAMRALLDRREQR